MYNRPYEKLMEDAECKEYALAEKIFQLGRINAIVQRENADRCVGCVFELTNEWELPCAKCKRNAKDYWRAKEQSNDNIM